MIKNLTAGTLLDTLVYVLMAGIVGLGGFGYYVLEQSDERAGAARQSGRDLGTALAMARAADAAGPGAEEAARKYLDGARQLLGSQGIDGAALEDALRARSKPGEKPAEVAPGLEALVQQHVAKTTAQEAAHTQQLGMAVAFMVLFGIATALRLRHWIQRSNGRPLKAATLVVEQIAAGDLTVRAEGMDQAHTRRLATALDDMTGSLRNMALEVVRSARTVADTSAQIAQGNLDLSQRTEEQASTLEQTASSMEELTSTVAQNADNARQASQLAIAASDVARKGGQVVGQVVTTMEDISGSSRRIGDIIGVIDGIAFQTNILALNAAVEAARAGEQGRGFAVVAAEVRSLAQRSAAAAKEIKGLIGDSVGKVDAGTKLVDAAGKTMGEIVDSVKKVSDLIAEIAAASQEQSAGIGQINTAVAQMEQVVHQNASLVEEASAATESMKEQAGALLHSMSRFSLGAHSSVSASSRPGGPQPGTPAKIVVRRPNALAPVRMAVPAVATRKSRAGAGEWEEF